MEKKLSITAAIAQARKEVTENYTWDESRHAWIETIHHAGQNKVTVLRDRRVCYALALLGVPSWTASDFCDKYGPGSFPEIVRNSMKSWANKK